MKIISPHFGRIPPVITAQDAIQTAVKPGSNVFIHTAAMAPVHLLESLVEQRERFFTPVNLFHMHTDGTAKYLDYPDRFRSTAFFCAANDRKQVNEGSAYFVPMFLSEVPKLWKTGRLPLDVCLLQVSPPDRHGWCSLGCSVDVSLSAMHFAKHTIAVVNKHVPRTHGDGVIHVSRIDSLVEHDEELFEHHPQKISDIEMAVGKNVAELIPNGSTLQMGIGNIPDAVLSQLNNHKDIGIHSEMFSDGVIDLIESGVINGSKKSSSPFQTVGSFAIGSKKLFNYIDDNPSIKLLRTTHVNDTFEIKNQNAMHAINSCIQIDLSGQVCADSIGTRIYSGVGGQMDFMRGAALSDNGKPIIAMTSRTNKGVSRIVSVLNEGAGVVTTRSHVHYVVTEYGTVDLFGKNMQERAKLLTSISHPEDRENLEKEFSKRYVKKT